MRISALSNYNIYSKPNFCARNSALDTKTHDCFCVTYLQDKLQNTNFGDYPREYTESTPYGTSNKPYYAILDLCSNKSGEGAKAIKKVVRGSLENPKTEGRVMLAAIMMEQDKFPAGFYYKLGFRFIDDDTNDIFDAWLKSGGSKATAPHIEGTMYMPKANIQHCLNY